MKLSKLLLSPFLTKVAEDVQDNDDDPSTGSDLNPTAQISVLAQTFIKPKFFLSVFLISLSWPVLCEEAVPPMFGNLCFSSVDLLKISTSSSLLNES